MHTNKELRDINISKCYLLLREKFKIDSEHAKLYLGKEFFLDTSTITSHILGDREKHREVKLEPKEMGLVLRTLNNTPPTKNPIFL